MGIGSALNISLTGLKTNQQQLDLTANNVANAGTAGYSRRMLQTSALVAGDTVFGVYSGKVQRTIDLAIQRQWREATGNSSYAQTRADMMDRLDGLMGAPGDATALDTMFNSFKSELEKLATSPESSSQRIQTAAAADSLATRIRGLSADVQRLRQDAESSIASNVKDANGLLMQIAEIDKQVIAVGSGDNSTAGLEDERDKAIDALSKLMDVKVEDVPYGGVRLYTSDGTVLYDGGEPVQLTFDERAVITADNTYSVVKAERTVGTLMIASGPGAGRDLFADNTLRSGKIAAYRELRDETLVRAQGQFDELAAQLANAVGTNKQPGKGVTGGAGEKGYSLDLTGLTQGNTVKITYSDGSGSHTVSFVAHDGTATLDNDYTADPKDTVVGIDLSGASGSVRDQIAAALPGLTVDDLGSNVLQVLDDGPSGSIDIQSFTASITANGMQNGSALPLFLDSGSNAAFTGLTGNQRRTPGFASRIILNPAVKADPSTLVKYATTTEPTDSTRPRAIIDSLTNTTIQFPSDSGIGSRSAPFTGTVEDFLKQVISSQGAEAQQAKALADGQSIVTKNLEERYDGSRKVDIDSEMADLIKLQTAYQANARVMTVAQEMLKSLMDVLR